MKFKNLFGIIFLVLLLSFTFSIAPTSVNLTIVNSSGNTITTTQTTDINFTISTPDGDTNSVCFAKSDSSCSQISDYVLSFKSSYNLSETGLSLSQGNNNFYAFVRDNNSETLTRTISSVKTVSFDTTGPTITVTFPQETDYNSASINGQTIQLNFSDTSGIDKNTIKFDNVNVSPNYTFSSVSDGDHNLVIDVNDTLGNTTQKVVLFKVDNTAPTSIGITNSYKTNYTTDETPDFTITGTDSGMNGGKARLSCSSSFSVTGTNSFEVSLTGSSTTISDFNITSSTYDCNSEDGNKLIFVKVRDKAGNYTSSSVGTNVMYDNTAPGTPINVSASAGNGKATISWDAPSPADASSGVSSYKIYKSTNGGSYSALTTTSNKTIDANSLTNGTQYCFRVSAIDAASNEGNQSEEKCTTPESVSTTISIKRDGENISYAKNGDTIDVSCSFSESISNAKIYIKYEGSSSESIKTTSSSVSSISDSFDIDEDKDSVEVWCEASGTSSDKEEIVIDNTSPALTWQDTNNLMSGMVRLYVKVTESHFDKLNISLSTTTYGTNKANDKNYYADINTKQIENGAYSLKAICYDLAGNKTEISRNITISNELTVKQLAEKSINEAKAKKTIAEDSFRYLSSHGIEINSIIQNKKVEADETLTKANSEYNSNPQTAKITAENAKLKFEEVIQGIITQTISSDNYINEENKVAKVLTDLGVNPLDANESENLSMNNKRKLEIVKVGSGDEYHTTIELTIKNDTNENSIKVIEIIPKEFVNKASEIFSDLNFTILQDDPIIEFNLNLLPGETRTISYGTSVTKDEADKIKDNNILAKFASQPITVRNDVNTTQLIGQNNLLGIIFLILEILFVVAILAILGFIIMQILKKNHGFKEVQKTPSETKKDESWPRK